MDKLIARSLKLTALTTLMTTLILLMMQRFSWAGGFLTGATWSSINFLLILNIFKIAFLEKKNNNKFFIMLLLKFPVLYLAGFFVLISKAFPVLSLLLGASLVLVVMGVLRLCLKFR